MVDFSLANGSDVNNNAQNKHININILALKLIHVKYIKHPVHNIHVTYLVLWDTLGGSHIYMLVQTINNNSSPEKFNNNIQINDSAQNK